MYIYIHMYIYVYVYLYLLYMRPWMSASKRWPASSIGEKIIYIYIYTYILIHIYIKGRHGSRERFWPVKTPRLPVH